MPFYFAVSLQGITAGTSQTDQLQLLTGSQKRACRVTGVYGAADNTTVGGIAVRGGRFGTASTSGSAVTPQKRDPDGPAAGTGANSLPTAGSTFTQQLAASVSQTGGGQPWFAIEPDAAVTLDPDGGANGNMDFYTLASAASMALDLTVEFNE